MGYIYLRTNKINGKKYVGQTTNIKKRNNEWNNLNRRYGGCVINNARKKYGVDGFSFEILKECPNEEMNYWEMYYVKEYNSKKPYGYNSTDGGDSIFEMTDEVRKKIADAKRGKHYPKVSAAMRGRKRPDISDALKGRKRPDIAAAHRGKKLSEEHKEKIGVALRGQKLSEETKAKLSAAKKGKKLSPEHKAKLSAAKKGKYNTKCSKAVQALDKINGEVVYEFPSAAEAQRQGFNSGCISDCCLGKRKSHKGFIWRYKFV